MARFSLSDSLEEPTAQSQQPAQEKKKRFSMEEPSQFKRKSEIALKNLAKGAISTGSTLYEAARDRLPWNVQGGKEMLERAAKLSNDIQEKLGLTPPEAESMAERLIAEGFQGIGAGALFGPAGAITGGVGGVAGQGAREAGLPEWAAKGIDIGTAALTPTKLPGKLAAGEKLVPKTAELAKRGAVAEAEKLPQVRGILKKPPKIMPVTTPEGMQAFDRKISKAIKDKSEEIMHESLLGKRLEEKGTYIGDLIADAYDQTLRLAKANRRKIDLTGLSQKIGKMADKIEKSAPSLSEATEATLKKLRKYESDFANTKMKAEGLTNQWQEINKDLNAIYAKTELTGSQELYRKSLEEVKEVLLKESKKQLKDKPLINSFEQQNKLYHEAQKFDKAKSLLDPVFENEFNPSKFRQVFSNEKKFSDLQKALGDKNAHRLKDIQKYYAQPIENLKKDFKVKSLFDLESVIKGAVVKKLVGLPVTAVLKLAPYARGKLLLSENTQNLWVKLMRSIKDGSVRGVEKYSEQLEKDLEEKSES